jgi:hypothetical protein
MPIAFVYRTGFILVLSAILWGGFTASGVAVTRRFRPSPMVGNLSKMTRA